MQNIKNHKFRNALIQFRASSHDLEIEKGRHSGVGLNERVCHVCKCIEDEMHFLLKCNMFLSLRRELFLKIENKFSDFSIISDLDKLKFLMQWDDPQLQTWVGKFVYDAFNLWKTILPM